MVINRPVEAQAPDMPRRCAGAVAYAEWFALLRRDYLKLGLVSR